MATRLQGLATTLLITCAVLTPVPGGEGAALAAGGAKEASGDPMPELKQKKRFGRPNLGPAYIQMRPILAPIKRRKNAIPTQAPVTVVLSLTSGTAVGTVCGYAPRINNALLRAWFKTPLHLKDLARPEADQDAAVKKAQERTSRQRDLDAEMVKVINESLGHEHVKSIMIFLGAQRGAQGGIARLPFSRNCAELERSEPAEDDAKKDGDK